MKNRNMMVVLMIVVVAAAGALIVSRSKTPPNNQQAITPSSAQTGGVKPAHEFVMTAKRFEFTPSSLTVKQGEQVTLKITSQDATHGFMLPDFNINEQLPPNKEVTIQFVADKKGTFTFACSVFCGTGHKSMKGTLIIE